MSNYYIKQLEAEIAKRENTKSRYRNVDTPWWADVATEAIRQIPEMQLQNANFKERQKDREGARIGSFESRVDRHIKNIQSSGKLYNDAELGETREFIETLYDKASDQNPELRMELTDIYDSRIGQLDVYSKKNKEWGNLEREVPIAVENLLGLTNDLTKKDWNDLSSDEKLKLKDRLLTDTQKLAELKSGLGDEYNKYRENYTKILEDVSGVSLGKQALFTQLRTFDPGRAVITDTELQAMQEAIINNDPSLINSLNNEALASATKRRTGKEKQIKEFIKSYGTYKAAHEDSAFQEQAEAMSDAMDAKKAEGKPITSSDYEISYRDEIININDFKSKMQRMEMDIKDLDQSYTKENLEGRTYKETFGLIRFPWETPKASSNDNNKQKGASEDVGIFQINTKTFEGYNPSRMSEDEMVKFASKIVYNELSGNPTVGDYNDNNGWNNWTAYKNRTDEYKLAYGRNDKWFLKNGLSGEQLNSINRHFKSSKDKNIAKAVMYAESGGDHKAINFNRRNKLSSNSFDDIVNYASQFKNKRLLSEAFKKNKLTPTLTSIIIKLQNLKTKYGEGSAQYKTAYNNLKLAHERKDMPSSEKIQKAKRNYCGAIR